MVQHPEISLVQNDPPLFFKQSLLIIGQKPYLTTYHACVCEHPPPPSVVQAVNSVKGVNTIQIPAGTPHSSTPTLEVFDLGLNDLFSPRFPRVLIYMIYE